MPELKISALLLAAGSSSRLGHPKQQIELKGKSLLEHTVEVILQSGIKEIVVVLGAFGEENEKLIAHLPVTVVQHASWERGIGSTLKAGLKYIQDHQSSEAILLTVCDQPFISSEVVHQLIAKFDPVKTSIVACAYGGTVGVPAIFGNQYFPQLQALNDQEGAKKILTSEKKIDTIDFPFGEMDLDTEEDLKKIRGLF